MLGASPRQGSTRDGCGTLGPGLVAGGQHWPRAPSWLPTRGSAAGTGLLPSEEPWMLLQPHLQPCRAPAHSRPLLTSLLPGQHLTSWVQGAPQAPIHPWGASGHPHPPYRSALTTAGPKPWGGEKQEPRALELLEHGVLHPPTHPRSSHRLPLGFLLCRLVPPAARCTRTWASRSRADLEALAQVNPSNPLIPGTKIGKISRSVGKALGQS